jgi:hypothetical protein
METIGATYRATAAVLRMSHFAAGLNRHEGLLLRQGHAEAAEKRDRNGLASEKWRVPGEQ